MKNKKYITIENDCLHFYHPLSIYLYVSMTKMLIIFVYIRTKKKIPEYIF